MAVVALPVFFAGILGLLALTGRMLSGGEPTPVGLVDDAGILSSSDTGASPRVAPGRKIRFVRFATVDEARRALDDRRIKACYVIEADYHATGRVTALRAPPRSPIDLGLGLDERDALAALLRARLVVNEPDESRRQLIVAPLEHLTVLVVPDHGQPHPASDDMLSLAGALLGPFGVAFFLSLGIFFSAGFLEQASSEERESRLLEVMLSMTRPLDFVAGKVVGLAGAGLVQMAFYGVLVVGSGPALAGFVSLAPGQLGWSGLYFFLGYLLFAALLTGTSMVVRSAHESLQIATAWSTISALPILLLLVGEPNGALARVLSFIPLTAPVAMLLRIGRSEVPLVDLVGSAAVIVIATWAALWASARLLRASMLMRGQALTAGNVLHWLTVK